MDRRTWLSMLAGVPLFGRSRVEQTSHPGVIERGLEDRVARLEDALSLLLPEDVMQFAIDLKRAMRGW